MGTKKETQQTVQFDPASKALYDALQGPLGNYMKFYMAQGGDPFKSPFFNIMLQQQTGQAQQLGGRGMQNIMGNIAAGGQGAMNLPAYLQEAVARQGRSTSQLQAQAFMNAAMQSQLMQQQAAGMAAGYNPLQTGRHTTESTSGLGAWLPQVAGMGASLAMAPFTGGMSLAPSALGYSYPGGAGSQPLPSMAGIEATYGKPGMSNPLFTNPLLTRPTSGASTLPYNPFGTPGF